MAMASLTRFFSLFLTLSCLSNFALADDTNTSNTHDGRIQITLDKLPDQSAGVIVYIYRSKENFLKQAEESYYIAKEDIVNNQFTLEHIKFGKFALSVAADLNGNKELDTRIFGIPAEPVGFAGNPKPRFGPPRFKECVFSFNQPDLALNITLLDI